jgi:hypothetical protein
MLQLPAALEAEVLVLHALFEEHSPVEATEELSRSSRLAEGFASIQTLAYGELSIRDAAAVVQRLKHDHLGLKEGGTICDLGSGAGLALFAARYCCNARSCMMCCKSRL